ncbi:MAG: hypothetical protein MUD03_02985 [Pirellula sp.]|nr:hypothetical protein [Pirellula sp.]
MASLLEGSNLLAGTKASAANGDGTPAQIAGMLGARIRAMETRGRPESPAISSGIASMDRCLPASGYACGSLVEFLTERRIPHGATSIALGLAREASRTGKYVVLIDPDWAYYPPALARLGLPLERIIGIRPKNHADLIWALDQVLRNPAVGCVVASVDRMEDRTARRIQLAAEAGGGLGILLRTLESARMQPSWADVQWFVSSRASDFTRDEETRWFHLALRRCQGGKVGTSLKIGIDASGNWVEQHRDEVQRAKTGHVHLAAELARPARVRREIAG